MRARRRIRQHCLQQFYGSECSGSCAENGGHPDRLATGSTPAAPNLECLHEGSHVVGDLLSLAFALHDDLVGIEHPRHPCLDLVEACGIHLELPCAGHNRLLERTASGLHRGDRLHPDAHRQHLVQAPDEAILRISRDPL